VVNLVYILSAGHSGSTLLDMIIGSLPGVFSLGEVTFFSWQIYRDGKMCELDQDICSCGYKFSECSVWKKIINNLSAKVGYNIYTNPYRFDVSIFRPLEYGKPYKKFHKFVRAYYNKLFYKNKFAPDLTPIFYHYTKKQIYNNLLLFDTIKESFGVSHVVDSSKDLIRLHFLHYVRPQNTKIIVLIRDILGIAGSAVKRNEDPLKAAKMWIRYYNLIINAVNKMFKNFLLVKYEELASKPRFILNKIAKFLDKEYLSNDSLIKLDTKKYHLIAGNPMRYKGLITIKPDMSWQKLLTSYQIALIKKMGEKIFDRINKVEGHCL